MGTHDTRIHYQLLSFRGLNRTEVQVPPLDPCFGSAEDSAEFLKIFMHFQYYEGGKLIDLPSDSRFLKSS